MISLQKLILSYDWLLLNSNFNQSKSVKFKSYIYKEKWDEKGKDMVYTFDKKKGQIF